ncbi:MAG: lipopolysaccharide heptosyltransferase II [Melioribacteraceae bacterium]|nr:lipopolysaccharide heptosyltransferase II [Melioribacteraceae bacterium]
MKKILVIQTAFIGDAILTLPLIQFLKQKYINPEITVLAIPSTSSVFENSNYVSNVIVYDKKGSEKSLLSYLRLIQKIKKMNFEIIYSPHRSVRSTLISFFSGAKNTIGFDKADLSFLYKKIIPYNKSDHEVKRNLALADFDFEKNNWKILPEIEFENIDKEKIDKLFFNDSKKLIAIAPGSVWNTKVYPKNYYIEIAKWLIDKNYFIVLLGGKEDEQLCEEIKSIVKEEIISLAGKINLIESVYFLKKCNALICNDSAPTHMAMIANIPVLTIYCSTIPEFGFYPYNEKSTYISFNDLDCKPCGIHGHKTCPVKTFNCAYKLIPEKVIKKFEEIISD